MRGLRKVGRGFALLGVASGALTLLGVGWTGWWVRELPVADVRPTHPFFDHPGPMVWAHRGASAEAPGNTLPAFERALDLGADVLETDLRLAADGVVLSHDATVDTVSAATGTIRSYRLAELGSLNLASGFVDWRGRAWSGGPVGFLSLDTFLDRFAPELRSGSVKASFELKEDDPELADRLWAEIVAHQVAPYVVVSSFSGEALAYFRSLAGDTVATLAPTGDVLRLLLCSAWGAVDRFATRGDALALFPVVGPLHFDDPGLVQALTAQGLPVTFMTINDEAEMRRLMALGARGIITDRPDLALGLLGRAGEGPF